MQRPYPVQLEIAGPAAMFTRPDSGGSFVSYPAPTYCAAKGIFESIARLKTAYIRPTQVEICKPIRYHRYVTNYRGPLRKGNQLSQDASYQLPAVILVDVCYRLYGVVQEAAPQPGPTNHLHALQEMFLRRAARGQSFTTPCLGWKEFTPSYFGALREGTEVQRSLNEEIPSMLHAVFNRNVDGEWGPRFIQAAQIREGVLRYAE